jgi:hypothetical protein
MNQDEEHLRLLTIFHYVVAGLAGLFSCFPIIHLVMWLFILFAPTKFSGGQPAQAPAEFIGWIFVIAAGFFILFGLTFTGFVLAAGRCLAKRKAYTFCLVMACVECLFMPFGTVLGVFSIVVLNRATVKQLFGK